VASSCRALCTSSMACFTAAMSIGEVAEVVAIANVGAGRAGDCQRGAAVDTGKPGPFGETLAQTGGSAPVVVRNAGLVNASGVSRGRAASWRVKPFPGVPLAVAACPANPPLPGVDGTWA